MNKNAQLYIVYNQIKFMLCSVACTCVRVFVCFHVVANT